MLNRPVWVVVLACLLPPAVMKTSAAQESNSKIVLTRIPASTPVPATEIDFAKLQDATIAAGDASQDESPSDRNLGLGADDEDVDPADANNDSEAANSDAGAEDSLAPLQNRPLSMRVTAVNLSLADLGTGLTPEPAQEQLMQPVPLPTGISRGAVFQCVHWYPSGICHYPLYFEDAMLERHGQVRYGHLQPLASGAKFFATIPLLPYLKTLQPTCQPRYALGHYRPGSCAPVLKDHLPYDRRAAIVETLSLAGFFWAVPL